VTAPFVTSLSLAGIRAATTAPQLELLARLVPALRADERIRAAWLVGSFALGTADAFSDLDVHCLVAAGTDLPDTWPDLLRRVTPLVLAKPFPGNAVAGGVALTPEWLHLDLALHPEPYDVTAVTGMRPLFDRTGLLPAGPVPLAATDGAPHLPADVVQWFFYLLGTFVVVVGRNEPAWAMNGVITLRDDALVPLMMAERGVRKVGGNKRLEPFLSPEQRAVLRGIPPLAPAIDAVVAAECAIARDFIPRGRALAARLGTPWPDDLERATVRWFEHGLGVTLFG
jgi:hypothetical protein